MKTPYEAPEAQVKMLPSHWLQRSRAAEEQQQQDDEEEEEKCSKRQALAE